MIKKILILLCLTAVTLTAFSFDKKFYISIISSDGKSVIISKSSLTKDAAFYSFRHNDKSIKFFAILDGADLVHIAFDACDVCWQAKKGYTVTDKLAVCNNCGSSYPLSAIGKDNVRGGCRPSYLPIKEENGNIIISVKDIAAKGNMF